MARGLYPYVGPKAIRIRATVAPSSCRINSLADLQRWIDQNKESMSGEGLIAATFVIDPELRLRLADRRSEHVACAGGGAVLSAGEMFFSAGPDGVTVEEVSNLSTGYCPEPESWAAVGEALDRIGVVHPGEFTKEVTFRRCTSCGERNVVKDGWFECQVCGAELPLEWNLG
jgi:hypothetical protein